MRTTPSLLGAVLVIGALAVPAAAAPPGSTPERKRAIADEMDAYLWKHVTGPRFPACVDKERGGFHTNYSRNWTALPDPGRFILYQARVVWTAATVAIQRPERKAEFLPYVRHGVRYLADVMWDKTNGGFHTYVGLDGKPASFRGAERRSIYGQAFAIYSLAAAHAATGDPEPLELAKRGFAWVEAHFRDAGLPGYRSSILPTGTPVPDSDSDDAITMGGPSSLRTMNDHIHMLEAYAELYRVWPDPLLAQRTQALLEFIRDQIFVEPGCLYFALYPNGKPVPAPVSFGHDVETGFLMIEAEEALGRKPSAATLRAARMLVDQALVSGFNHKTGQIHEYGSAFGPSLVHAAQWWSQFEMVNALLLMHDLYGQETDKYWVAFEKAWALTRDELADKPNPGVCLGFGEKGEVECEMKSHDWFVSYHSGRALILTANRLRATNHK